MSGERERAIREQAYAIWEQEGRPVDRSLLHWLQAETEIGPERVVSIMDDGKPVKSRRRKTA
jgi:aspartyl/asparaginyl beta-hydroxylase (cupin superfamily)